MKVFIFLFIITHLSPTVLSNERISLGGHASPNEWNPQDAQEIFIKASLNGSFVSVGSERGFIGASLAKSKFLFLADFDPEVFLFNKINIALLAISNSIEDYRFLRLNADFELWKSRAQQNNSSSYSEELQKISNWRLWNEYLRVHPNRNWRVFHQNTALANNNSLFFDGANYLWFQDQYEHLAKLAKSGNIETQLLSLDSKVDLQKLINFHRTKNLEIAVFDMSNAWHPQYLSLQQLSELMKVTSGVMNAKSVLLLTNYARPAIKEIYGGSAASVWEYFGFTLEYIMQNYNSYDQFWGEKLRIYQMSHETKKRLLIGKPGGLMNAPRNKCEVFYIPKLSL
ncbi:MAG: hypothetical protein JNM24_07485 [Bdellovibrionaceae bacterium]|nr:hypothetical protein [Pseudobdellovibrionaceae bacterium]